MVFAERDPDFRAKAIEKLGKRAKVVVYCTRGGTIEVRSYAWLVGKLWEFINDLGVHCLLPSAKKRKEHVGLKLRHPLG